MFYEEQNKRWIFLIGAIILVVLLLVYFVFFGSSKGDENIRKAVAPQLSGCDVLYEGNGTNKISIVFLPDNYDSYDEFKEGVNKMIDSFLSTIPYNSYKDKFSFYAIPSLDLDLGCNYRYGGDAIVCEPTKIKQASLKCPHDYPVVVVDTDGVQKLFELLRSSSWMGTISVNVADDPLVLTHEFAHSFADFADEYEYGGKITWDAPNCDSEWQTCPKFSIVNGSECVRGCVNNENSRPIKVGIMRDYWKSKVYGAYDEYVLENLILERVSGESLVLKSAPLYSARLKYLEGSWKIVDVQEDYGFVDRSFEKGVGRVVLVDSDGNILSEVSLPNNEQMLFLDGHDENGEFIPSTEIKAVDEIIINVEKIDDAKKVEVIKNDEIVSEYALESSSNNGNYVGGVGGKEIDILEVFQSS